MTVRQGTERIDIHPARSLEDIAMIFAIRAATYIADQDCPYTEEFDGNDFAGTQIIARYGSEPAGCIRLRYFGEFVKLERLAVLPAWRGRTLSKALISYGLAFARRKGFSRFCAHVPAHTRLLWQSFGFEPGYSGTELKPAFTFSGFDYCELHLTVAQAPSYLCLSSLPLVLIRPEGDWDRPGILDRSATREKPTHHKKEDHDGYIRSA